jgi:hypothetical protein
VTSTARAGEPVCYLDYDGCLHRCNVRWSKQRGMFLEAPGRYSRFQHARLLEELLAPYPAVRVVLSTSWAQKLGLKEAVRHLPESLQRRYWARRTKSRSRATSSRTSVGENKCCSMCSAAGRQLGSPWTMTN